MSDPVLDSITKAVKWRKPARALAKCPTGIPGLDQITHGGLPQGRPTLVCGGPGCGKTVLAVDFIVRGIMEYHEPGVFVSFEERPQDIARNAATVGYDFKLLQAKKKLAVDYIHIEKTALKETGEYDLEALFIRLDLAIRSVKAKRVVLDGVDTLFSSLRDTAVVRAELRRLFFWLKEKNVTAIITAERGEGTLTRQGLEEYMSDCVILLDQRIAEEISTRRLRLVKYRGSSFDTNEYPFLINENGFSVIPITSLGFQHQVPSERVTTGLARLDAMLGGGLWRASSVLLSGTPGTGKTTLGAHFLEAACGRGERGMMFSLDESAKQIERDMGSVGIDLGKWVKKDLLRIDAFRASMHGLEEHLLDFSRKVLEFKPSVVVVDPISGLLPASPQHDVQAMLVRLIDFLKGEKITALFTSKGGPQAAPEESNVGVSNLIDTWLIVRDLESDSERNRGIFIVKSRGTHHSNQVREFLLTDKGVQLLDDRKSVAAYRKADRPNGNLLPARTPV